jgi:hypothetical protein
LEEDLHQQVDIRVLQTKSKSEYQSEFLYH